MSARDLVVVDRTTGERFVRLSDLPRMEGERDAFRALLAEFVARDHGPCRIDRSGFCQEHFTNSPCLVARAKAMLDTPPEEER